MNEAMQKLIDAVQKASPIVWQAAYRQVWIDGIENLLLTVFFAVSASLLWKWRKRVEDEVGQVLLAVLAMASMGLTVIAFLFTLDFFLNPTFAAIKELRQLF